MAILWIKQEVTMKKTSPSFVYRASCSQCRWHSLYNSLSEIPEFCPDCHAYALYVDQQDTLSAHLQTDTFTQSAGLFAVKKAQHTLHLFGAILARLDRA
tara:strand:+ start:804 stop:1100 length:297 start_codon:yes stop_codon:yes gene_type:complete